SDVLYEPAHPGSVSAFIHRHSSANVHVVIVDPNRGNRATFTKKMAALGFAHHFEVFDTLAVGVTGCKGRILHYRRQLLAA
ncbi:MAG: hypothetical protein OEW08_14610, partial [Gammaproteobacteria bacterium]|nr:hypothetical protein [Gammaproteobacteria bacterium]